MVDPIYVRIGMVVMQASRVMLPRHAQRRFSCVFFSFSPFFLITFIFISYNYFIPGTLWTLLLRCPAKALYIVEPVFDGDDDDTWKLLGPDKGLYQYKTRSSPPSGIWVLAFGFRHGAFRVLFGIKAALIGQARMLSHVVRNCYLAYKAIGIALSKNQMLCRGWLVLLHNARNRRILTAGWM